MSQIDFLEEIYDKLDESKAINVIYLDFAKAFDKVPHSILAAKLETCRIGGKVLRWVNKLAGDRRQKVGIKYTYTIGLKSSVMSPRDV